MFSNKEAPEKWGGDHCTVRMLCAVVKLSSQ